MRSFFVFGIDPSRRDLEAAVDDDLAGFDHTQLTRGSQRVSLPHGFRLVVSERPKRADLLGNGFGWKIMSARAVEVVRAFVSEQQLQVLELPVFSLGGAVVRGYYLVNCLCLIPALAFERGNQMVFAHRVVISESKVPPDCHLFRVAEEPFHWVVSLECWQRLSTFDGFDATRTQTAP
jgi:hypothetical protein